MGNRSFRRYRRRTGKNKSSPMKKDHPESSDFHPCHFTVGETSSSPNTGSLSPLKFTPISIPCLMPTTTRDLKVAKVSVIRTYRRVPLTPLRGQGCRHRECRKRFLDHRRGGMEMRAL